MKNRFLCFLLIAAALLCTAGCGQQAATVDRLVRVEMEDGGVFYIELYPEYAPKTVQNFIELVEEGFYNGLIFHRVETGVLIQGGDPEGTGYGGSGKAIKGEFSENGCKTNTLKHTEGIVSMARTNDPNSATSQFFICEKSLPSLDGKYAAFGKVISGMETVHKIGSCRVNGNKPIEPQRMKTVTMIEKSTIETNKGE